jgi:hypothetical protein
MFGFFRPLSYEHYVDGGCVYCQRRGRDVEIDLCTGCESLTRIDLEAKPPYICCEGAPSLGYADPA